MGSIPGRFPLGGSARRGSPALSAILLLALILPLRASAETSRESWSFSTRASNGYRVDVSIGGGHAVVFVGGRTALAEYAVPAKVTKGVVEARFGDLGAMSMKFVPSGPPTRSDEPNGCHGYRPKVQKGDAVGRFRFHGERRYLTVATQKAPAYLERGFTRVCGGVGHPEIPNLVARAKSGRRSISVSTYFREFEVSTDAEITERIGPMSIWRAIALASPIEDARSAPDGSVTISPSQPFAGSVRYSPTGPARWTGDLSAVFPGLGSVPLSGRQFKVTVFSPLPSLGS